MASSPKSGSRSPPARTLSRAALSRTPAAALPPLAAILLVKPTWWEKISHRFTAPGIGKDLGCTQDSLRDTFLGFYYAPGVVCEALKTAVYAQCLLELVGVNPVPRYTCRP